ncbi:NHL domain-containing protein [Paludibaculum fermentans]|uniref:Teneurin NHL domain-containing protein n=1 Tax=Paludibaculum fermentans TaxID=1473598 RepID=A0A7S7SK40_PALFE|nr:hypothetical protein [Paludibaculum fermentans]QOY88732.1 hypothetical protein IRI77_01855 [Paludibaculum fermentans]
MSIARIGGLKRKFAGALVGGGLLLGLPLVSSAQSVPSYVISTFAGTGANDATEFAGDDGPATSAQLNNPYSVAIDSAGNVYIADQVHHRIRKVSTSGIITTIAGTDTASWTGDDAVATSGTLNAPCGLLIDPTGDIYIADTLNHVIRKITTSTGKISTFAGTNVAGFSGDGDGVDTGTATVTDTDPKATAAQLNRPTALARDSSGNLYIADTYNSRIRKILASNSTIDTVVGDGAQRRYGDGGLATEASLFDPQGINFDAAGNLYIADTNNHVIRKVTTDGNIQTVAGSGVYGYTGDEIPATQASLFYPKWVAVDTAGNLFIADSFNMRIRMVTTDGIIHTIAGNGTYGLSGDGGAAIDAELRFPSSVTIGSGGKIYVTDNQNHRVALLTPVVDLGLSAPTSLNLGGKQYVNALLSDNQTLVLPTDALAGTASRPAHIGETITMYANGLGDTDEQINETLGRIQIYFGHMPADISYAGEAGDGSGAKRLNVVVPNIEDNDAIPVMLMKDGTVAQKAIYTAVRSN